jgi:class 3 adenylate cyclase
MSTERQNVDLEAERRPVTVLLGDLVGFTAFSDAPGRKPPTSSCTASPSSCAIASRREGGAVRNFTGDGVMALLACLRRWRTRRFVLVVLRC